jgi:osmoprotectant transport system substrate-binding protein
MMKRIFLIFMLVLLTLSLCFTGCSRPRITVSSWADSEGALLAQMMVSILSENGFEVINLVPAGTVDNVHQQLKEGKIDIYPEYTGYYPEDIENPDSGIVWLKPAPADSKWAIVLSGKLSRDENIKTMSDFASYVNNRQGPLKLICASDFITDKNALPNFERGYGFTLESEQLVIVPGNNHVYMGTQVVSDDSDINAAMAYTTDGYISKYDLVLLEDDKGSQPSIHPAPIMRKEIFDRYGDQLNRILTPLFQSIDNATLRSLNAQIGLESKNAMSEVARNYLIENGYFKYDELQMVQKAMDEMMLNNNLKSVPANPDATSNMSEFPSRQYALYTEKTMWPYLTWKETRGTYTCDSNGVVHQESTGW